MTRTTLLALLSALTLSMMAGCAEDEKLASAPGVASQALMGCIDEDHDGFGDHCAAGFDCDDEDAAVGDECLNNAGDCVEGETQECGKIMETAAGSTYLRGSQSCVEGAWSVCVTK